MDLLLDTHTRLWWLAGDDALSSPTRAAVEDTTGSVFVSAASAWGIATKFRVGKLPGAAAACADLARMVAAPGYLHRPISLAHGQAADALFGLHKDPFDRMLMAQAVLDGMVLVSNEQRFDVYGVRRLW